MKSNVHMMGIIFILILFAFSYNAKSQEGKAIKLSGIILDSISNLPLPNAGLILRNERIGIEQKGTANAAGIFSFNISAIGDYSLIVKYVGYKDYYYNAVKILGKDVLLPSIKLSSELTSLKTVNVASRKPFITQSLDRVTMNVSESSLSAGTTALEILQQAPGVQISQSGISLKSKAVSVYIDGRPSYLVGEELKNWLNSQPSNSIDKIELISNPSAKYDASSSAIINIKTTKMLNYGSNGSLNIGMGAGKFGRANGGVNLNYRKEKINIYGSYNFMGLKQFSTLENNRILQNDNQYTYLNENQYSEKRSNVHSVKAGVDFDINAKNTVGVLFRGSFTDRTRNDESSTSIGLIKHAIDSTFFTSIVGSSSWNSPSANVFYKFSDAAIKKSITINGDYYRYDKSSRNGYKTDYFGNSNQKLHSGTELRDNSPGVITIKSLTADYERTLKLGKLSFGVKSAFTNTDNDVKWENLRGNWSVDPEKTNHFVYDENVNAAYFGFSRQVKKIGIQLMVRGEQTNVTGNSITMNTEFTKNYFQLFPSLAFQYSKSAKNQFSFAYRKSIERPLYQYVNPFLLFQSTYNYFQGNPDLDPMTKHEIELSWAHKQTIFTSFSYNYIKNFYGTFYKENVNTKGIISYLDNYKYGQSINLNIAVSKTIQKWWGFNGNLSSSYFKGSYPSVETQKSTPNVNLSVNNGFLFKNGWSADLFGLFTSPFSDGFYHYKSNYLVNAGITKSLNKNSNIKLTSSDIFKTYKTYYTTHYSNINLENIARYDTRSVTLTYSYKFGNVKVKKQNDRKVGTDKEEKRIGQ